MLLPFLLLTRCNTGPRWFQTCAHELGPGLRVGRTLRYWSVWGNERAATLLATFFSHLQWCSDPNTEQNEPDPRVLKLTSALCSNELQSVLIEFPTIHSRFQQIISPPSPLQMGAVLRLIRRQDCPQPPDIILRCRARHLFVFSGLAVHLSLFSSNVSGLHQAPPPLRHFVCLREPIKAARLLWCVDSHNCQIGRDIVIRRNRWREMTEIFKARNTRAHQRIAMETVTLSQFS